MIKLKKIKMNFIAIKKKGNEKIRLELRKCVWLVCNTPIYIYIYFLIWVQATSYYIYKDKYLYNTLSG